MSGHGRGRKSRHRHGGHGGGHGGRRARKPRPGSDAGGGGGGHGGGDSRWMVTYADMLTLLMVLFLVLWVLSTLDLAKFEKFKSGLGEFGNPAANAAAGGGGGAETDAVCATEETTDAAAEGDGHSTEEAKAEGDGHSTDEAKEEGDGHSTEAAAEPDPCLGPGDAGIAGEGGGTGDGTAGSGNGSGGTLGTGDLPAVAQEVQQAVNAAGFPDVVSVSVQERGLVVVVTTDNVLFGSGAADITGEGAAMIGVVASTLNQFTNRIVVEGHTDKRPLRREGYDNWDLSVDRAVSVIKLLRDQYGIDSDRLTAAGFGERRPIAEGDDEASLARNRRVEIVVLAQTPGDYTTAPDAQATPPATTPADADAAAATEPETATG